jgi:hypothetical protein
MQDYAATAPFLGFFEPIISRSLTRSSSAEICLIQFRTWPRSRSRLREEQRLGLRIEFQIGKAVRHWLAVSIGKFVRIVYVTKRAS